MLEVTIKGKTYKLATNLRVAYTVQSQHNHKSYMTIFQEVDNYTLEDQIGIVYAAAIAGKSNEPIPSQKEFVNDFLDEPSMSVKKLMDLLKEIFQGITGIDIPEEARETDNEGEE